MKLTQTQLDLLAAVAKEEAGIPLDAAVNRRVANGLIKLGACMAVPQSDGPSRLTATTAGRLALQPAIRDHRAAETDVATSSGVALPAPSAASAPGPKGKLGALVALLERPEGARLEEMVAETGWQAHSVRGAMSGALKKKLGLAIVSEKAGGVRVYRIADGAAQ